MEILINWFNRYVLQCRGLNPEFLSCYTSSLPLSYIEVIKNFCISVICKIIPAPCTMEVIYSTWHNSSLRNLDLRIGVNISHFNESILGSVAKSTRILIYHSEPIYLFYTSRVFYPALSTGSLFTLNLFKNFFCFSTLPYM
jgi:hypothetical protein